MRIGSLALSEKARRDVLRWAGTFAAPLAWFAQLVMTYALAPDACSSKNRALLHLATLACVGVAALGLLATWREWEALGFSTSTDHSDPHEARVRYQAMAGLMASGTFLLVMTAEWLAIFCLEPCVP